MRTLPASPARALKGFTLVELMVVVALVTIITTLAVPAWNRMIVSNRIRAAVNDWTLSTQFARSEALRQNVPITLCPSNNGTNCTASDYETGWIVKTGLPAVAGIVLQDTLPKQRLTMAFNPQARRAMTFLPNGLLIGNFTGGHVTMHDDPASDNSLSRHLCIARTGRIRVYTDAQWMLLPAAECP